MKEIKRRLEQRELGKGGLHGPHWYSGQALLNESTHMEGGGKGLQVSEIIHKKIQSRKQVHVTG